MKKTLLLALLWAAPQTLPAQVKLSEKGTVSQIVNGTTITIEYHRPVARGREELFGKIVHWGEIWTPGANWSTSLEVDKDIRLNGHTVPKGKYSIWMITAKDSAWTFFLNTNPRIWHTRRPKDTKDDVVRFQVQPQQLPYAAETLTWGFPRIERDSAILRMQWGTTAVSLRVNTAPLQRTVLTPAERQLYVGDYTLRYEGFEDSTKVNITEQQGKLIFTYLSNNPDPTTLELIPISDLHFVGGFREKGDVVEVHMHPITFQMDGARIVTFELHNAETNKLMARGRRSN